MPRNSEEIDSFMDFMIKFFRQEYYKIKHTKYMDEQKAGKLKFLLCLNNVSQLVKNSK